MKLTKKQRIALEFLAEVGSSTSFLVYARNILDSLVREGLAVYIYSQYRITREGREALKEAQR